jgi:putative endonuclease
MYVYILQSLKLPDDYYVGITNDLKSRLEKHNAGQVPHTSKFRPWRYKNAFWFLDNLAANKFEKYLKTGSGRAFAKKHF